MEKAANLTRQIKKTKEINMITAFVMKREKYCFDRL